MSRKKLVVMDAKLLMAIDAGSDLDETFDNANMMLIPQQLKEGGQYGLVDYTLDGVRLAGIKLENYDYNMGFTSEPEDEKEPEAPKARGGRETNADVLARLMNYSQSGAIMQMFIMDALTKASKIVADIPYEEFEHKFNESGAGNMISPLAWHQAAKELHSEMERHLK